MKIGILTFHRPVNYGAFLQSYSLSENLIDNFKDDQIEIIDYIAPKEKKKIYLNVLISLKHHGIKSFIKEMVKVRTFRKSLKFLHLSEKYFCTDNLQKLYEYIEKNYDALIIGSDAVFNWNQNGFPTAFIPNYKFKNCKVLTYAASVHGLKYLEENKEQIKYCKEAFSNMEFIGVRDKNTENFVSFCNPLKTAVHCCDPTVFLNYKALYSLPHRDLKELSQKYKINLKRPYIVLMLENEKISRSIFKKYSNEFNIISLFKPNRYSNIFLYDLSPIEWAEILKNASLVFTNYFHGTLISLTQNTPVFSIDLSNYSYPYEGKLPDLMVQRFNLSKLFVYGNDWESKESSVFLTADKILQKEISFDFPACLSNERKSFDAFLKILNNKIKLN